MNLMQGIRFGAQVIRLRRVARQTEPVGGLQRRRLEKLLRFASSHSKFHRDRLRGIDSGRCDLGELPITTKTEMMENFEDTLTVPGIDREEVKDFMEDRDTLCKRFRVRFVPSHTSGSSGQALLMLQEPKEIELLFALQSSRGNCQDIGPREVFQRWLSPARLAVVTMKRGFYPSASAFEYMPSFISQYIDIRRHSQTDEDVVGRLNEFRPTHLTAYAGVLSRLVEAAMNGTLRLDGHLAQITNNSEVLSERLKRQLQSVFSVPVLDNYATGECPFLSNGCLKGHGVHINADWVILENVDENNRPVADGVPGKKVLITNLSNTIQPLIRYVIDDVVVMATNDCGCGNALPRIEEIGGRATDVFVVKSDGEERELTAVLFQHALENQLEIREWQAVQTAEDRFVLRVELLPGAKFDAASINRAIERQLAHYDLAGVVDVEIEAVARIEPDPKTHKIRRAVVSEAGKDHSARTSLKTAEMV